MLHASGRREKTSESPTCAPVEIPEDLRTAAKRVRRMLSAWAALAPCCPAERAREIAENEFAIRRQLWQRAKEPDTLDATRVQELHEQLDGLARTICSVAFDGPLERMQAILPQSLEAHEQRLFDLLDLLTADAIADAAALPEKLPAVDALITFLCSEGRSLNRDATRDPVTVTNVMRSVCQRVEARGSDDVGALEAAFFAAADRGDLDELREMNARKANLGMDYFAPRVLRAVVTCNLSLARATPPPEDPIAPQQPAGAPEPAPPKAMPTASGSLFGCAALGAVLEAVQKRLDGQAVQPGRTSRIAGALDLDTLHGPDRVALREGRFEVSELRTAVVLVGLLQRSAGAIGQELRACGIEPQVLAERWVEELDERVKIEVNDAIRSCTESVHYERARELSTLRDRFLDRPQPVGVVAGRAARPSRAAREQEDSRETRREARALASAAVSTGTSARPDRGGPLERVAWRRLALVVVGFALPVGMLLLALGVIEIGQSDIDRWGRRELGEVSEHLVAGRRNGGGEGNAFVGTVGNAWQALPLAEREQEARRLIEALRAQGITQVMIYDAERKLRIQALGEMIRAF